MTQEILYCSPAGIVLSSDSLVVRVREDGRREHLAVRKLFPLGPGAALSTAGAFAGVRISEGFAARARAEGLSCLEELLPAAQVYFEAEYGRFIRENQSWFEAHPEAHRSLYVLLAGRADRAEGLAWGARFLASEEHRLPFQILPIGEVLTVPRRLGLEGQLMSRLKGGSPLEDVAAFCHSALGMLGEGEPEWVGRPFYTAILDGQGFHWWQWDAESTGQAGRAEER